MLASSMSGALALVSSLSVFSSSARVCASNFATTIPCSRWNWCANKARLTQPKNSYGGWLTIRTQLVTLQGFWQGLGLDTEARLEITAPGIPLNATLLRALPKALKDTAESFHAVGRGDGTALIVRTRGVEGVQCSYHVQFHDTSVRWDYFPVPKAFASSVRLDT